MADAQRRPGPGLIDQLFEEPYRFDFFQAVRLLQRAAPERIPVGRDGPCSHEVARFVQHLSLAFPASSVPELDRVYRPRGPRAGAPASAPAPVGEDGEDGQPPRMVTSFMGLVGPMGALPTVYTEELVGPDARRRGAAIDFLDLFHHRMVSFFYRAWEKYNLPALWEDRTKAGGGTGPGNDRFSIHLFDLIGLGLAPLRDRQAFPDVSLLHHVGLFAQQHRSALMLERFLRDHFGCPVTVLSFSGRWLRLEPDQQTRMGRRGQFHALGHDAVAGHRVWDVQSKFRVRIGPLALARFRAMLPGGAACDQLMHLVRFYVRAELDFDVQLVLRAEDVPACRAARDPSAAAQLGRDAWLKRREFEHDADEAVFRPRD